MNRTKTPSSGSINLLKQFKELRLTVIFTSLLKDEPLYSHQKQDQKLTVAQIMNSYCEIQT